MTPHQRYMQARALKEAAGIVGAVMYYQRNNIEAWQHLFRVKQYLVHEASALFPEIFR
jgi:hypothetical protein